MTPPFSQKIGYLKYLAIFLAFFLVFFYAYTRNKDYNNLKNVLIKDKEDLKIELNEIAEDYKELNIKNKKLSRRVIREINKIIFLTNSVNELDVENFALIRSYRKKIARLQKENKILVSKVDSLNAVNLILKNKNILVNEILDKKIVITNELKNKNKNLAYANKKLETQIAPARRIKTSPINTIAMKEKSSGGLVKTLKSKRTDAFRINFTLLENTLAIPGNKRIYIQLKDSKNNIIAAKEQKTTLNNNTAIKYSDELIVNYKKENVDVLSLILVDRKNLTKGKYTINTYIDGHYNSGSIITLK